MSESNSFTDALVGRVYKLRWFLAIGAVLVAIGAFGSGIGRVGTFTEQVDALADTKPVKPEPRMFDPRTDIWFDSSDPALKAYREIEDRFIGEDPVLVAFTVPSDPHGVFSVKSLQAIDRLTEELKKIPYVRTVRSLVANPWIRWGAVEQEEGLIVSDLFEKDAAEYSERERLLRMVSVLGAVNATKLIGEAKVREVIGANANFDDYIGEPRLLGNVLSPDGRSTALVVQLVRPRLEEERLDEVFGKGTTARKAGPAIHTSVVQTEALHKIKTIVAADKSFEYHVTGIPVMQEHFQDIAQSDMSFIGLMFVAIAIVLLLIYRRAAGLLMPPITMFLAIMGMLGVVLLKGDLINGLTAMTPHMLIAIGVANAVHIVTAYYLLRPKHTDKHELIQASMRFNALPVFLASTTTAVGFLSLTTSSILPVRQFGYTAAIGAVFAFVISMTLVPALLSLFRLKPVKATKKSENNSTETKQLERRHWSEPLSQLVVRKRLPIVIGGIAITIAALLSLTRVNLTSDMRLMFGKGDPVVADVMWLDENIGGTGDLEILFTGAPSADTSEDADKRQERIDEISTKPEFSEELASLKALDAEYQRGRIAYSPEFLNLLNGFQNRLEEEARNPDSPLHILTSIDSALGVLRKMHQVQNENKGSFYRVPVEADVPEGARRPTVLYDEVLEEESIIPGQDASTMIAQYYLQFENGAKPEENLSTLITPDRRALRLTMRTRAAGSKTTLQAYERMREIARTEFPALAGSTEEVAGGKAVATMAMTGNFYMQMNMITAFAETLIVSLSLALIVITLLITLVFRSIKIGLVSMIPNILPIVLPLSALALFGVPLDAPAILVAAVGLGICVDDTIHFLTKYTKAIAKGNDSTEAIRMTFREVGGALTYTTIILVCGFSMMTMATFRPNSMIGFLGAAMIALAWVADFVLTPAVLSYLSAKPTSMPRAVASETKEDLKSDSK